MKKPRLLTLVTSCGLALLAVYTTVGCGRLDRTRQPPQEDGSDIVVPKAPEKMDTSPEAVRAQLKRSVHADLDCSGCHAPPADGKQPDELGKAQCTNCHADESKAYAETIHATANAEHGAEEAATCEDCHGMHDTRRVSDPQSRVSQRNTPATCGQCHDNPELAEKLGIKKPEAVKHYAESIHGRELVTHGLLVAPSCADCHGKAHHIFEAKDPRSTVNKYNVAETCGQCHAGAREDYLAGIHAKALKEEAAENGTELGRDGAEAPTEPEAAPEPAAGAAGAAGNAAGAGGSAGSSAVAAAAGGKAAADAAAEPETVPEKPAATPVAKKPRERSKEVKKDAEAPTCHTCHSAHSIIEPGSRFQLAADRICGECHEDRLKNYLATYHGQAHDLGDPDVAACHDCHGQHDILPSKNPESRLSDANKLATCQRCHVGAPANFAGYLVHADHTDSENYPTLYWVFIAMTGLLVGTFGFFGVHSLLWLGRALLMKFRDPKGFKEAKRRVREEKGARLYQRFRPVDRFVHILVIVSFISLVATGMPLKFHTDPWAHVFFDMVGGAAVAASIHRFAAIITFSYFAIHIGSLIALARRKRDQYVDEEGKFRLRRFLRFAFGPDSPFPRWQDAKDIWAHTLWFFGRRPRPKFERFTYWEKFDYMAVFWGVTMIGASGLLLWFPEFFSRFLPGWAINVAHIIHSDEALLAAGFIFVFHFFNSHFRPEKFPYDAVMFSGHITEAELEHERPGQYERMAEAGELDDTVPRGEWPQWRWIANTFGAVAIASGLGLAAAIFYAILF